MTQARRTTTSSGGSFVWVTIQVMWRRHAEVSLHEWGPAVYPAVGADRPPNSSSWPSCTRGRPLNRRSLGGLGVLSLVARSMHVHTNTCTRAREHVHERVDAEEMNFSTDQVTDPRLR